MKKFEFTGETKTISLFFRTATLHRIRAVAEFGHVKIGDLGGWIEKEENLKTKKIVGVGSDGGIEVHTVDVPYEARKVKLELDEKNIYRFGMGLNLSGLKDTSATTNIAIKAAYSLLDLRCKHLERNIKRFLRKIVAVCIDEINQQNGTDYQITDVYFEFTHEVMSNEQENEQNELTEAQKQQVQINTLLSLAQIFGDDLTIQYICDVLDIDYEDVKDKLHQIPNW